MLCVKNVYKAFECVINVYNNNIRHGGNHDVYKRGDDEEQIPRYREINERLVRAILKKWGL